MSERFPRDKILELWKAGMSAPEIARALGIRRWQGVSNLIYEARKKGDPRALRRGHERAPSQDLPIESPPPSHGFKTEFRRVYGMTVTLSAGVAE
jgi:hypothetical protein